MATRKPYQPTSLDRWVLRNRMLSTVLGAVLIVLAALMIFLNGFEVITGPLQYVAYVLMGLGMALVVVPPKLQRRLDEEKPT